jgi:hypothetical protein
MIVASATPFRDSVSMNVSGSLRACLCRAADERSCRVTWRVIRHAAREIRFQPTRGVATGFVEKLRSLSRDNPDLGCNPGRD